MLRWVVWLLVGCIGFAVTAWLFRSSGQPEGQESGPNLSGQPGAFDGRRDTPGAEGNLTGPAWVIDGDSLTVGTTEVRLHGVDAPEGAQNCFTDTGERWPCGELASRALVGLVQGRDVACDERDVDSYGRIVAVCRRGSTDVNSWMVANGWALAYRRYSDAYVDEESVAKAEGRGIWAGEFEAPWDWRQANRLRPAAHRPASDAGDPRDSVATRPAGASDRQPAGCNIKGNVSHNSGNRIYHMPGDRDYDITRINRPGERWFCSESEARAAGWRRAGS